MNQDNTRNSLLTTSATFGNKGNFAAVNKNIYKEITYLKCLSDYANYLFFFFFWGGGGIFIFLQIIHLIVR